MEHVDGFLSYEDKRKELITYIVDIINVTMQRTYNLRYKRANVVTGIDYYKEMEIEPSGKEFDLNLYRNVMIPIFLESENLDYNIVYNKSKTGYSFMEVSFYYDEELRKVYLYYIIDPNNRWGRSDLVKDIYTNINYNLIHNIPYDESVVIEIIGPAALYSDTCASMISNVLTTHTIAYFRALEKRYYFINDQTVTIDDKYKTHINNRINSFSNFRTNVHDINKKYKWFNDPDDIPEGFNEYKKLYKTYFDKELVEFDPDKMDTFYLLSFTDFSIVDKYMPNTYHHFK